MEGQHQSDDLKDKRATVQDSIKKLKEKFVPGVKYTLLISAIVHFAMLVVGCLNVHKCPVNKNIPLFLIATGAIGLMCKFISYVRDKISKHLQVMYLESALYSVESIFFFLGSYWVYKEFQPSYDPLARELYCNKTAYIFAFTYVTIFFVFLLACLFGFCCFICCIILLTTTCARTLDTVESQPTEATKALTITTQDVAESKQQSPESPVKVYVNIK